MWVYIRVDEQRWQPWANTVMYYPFTTDQLDKVGSSSLSWTWTQETLGYTFSANEYIYVNNPSTSCRFISVWVKYNSSLWIYSQSPSTYVWQILYNFQHTSSSYNKKFQIENSYNQWALSNAQSTSTWVWYHIAMGYDGSKVCCYINWNKVWEATSGVYSPWTMVLWRYINETISEFIWESVCWTDQEILNYYNQTKSLYGIS